MTEALARVAPGAPPARRAAVERLAGRLKAAVDFGQVDELMSGGVAAFIADITKQCEQIHKALYSFVHHLWRGDGALMFYSIRHVTRFRYSAPVRESR